jgi:hypothetical protein
LFRLLTGTFVSRPTPNTEIHMQHIHFASSAVLLGERKPKGPQTHLAQLSRASF